MRKMSRPCFSRLSSLVFGAVLIAANAEAKIYQSFADVAEKALPGVVNIRTTQFIKRQDGFMDPYEFFLQGGNPAARANHSLGTGVIADKSGFILTNNHVIQGANIIDILFVDKKKKVRAKVIGADRKTDLALLKIPASADLEALEFGDSDALRVGDIVLAIGNPFGFAHTVTSGIISAKGRVLGTGPYDSFLQTDATIHPGNSGGPLIDVRGRVIGINTAVSREGSGIGFAIPINIVKDVFSDLKKHGKVNRPWLGIVGKNIISQDEISDEYDPSGVYGVIVDNLVVGGPAHKSGIKIGDLIMAVNDEKVSDLNMLQRKVHNKSPSDQIRLKIYRRTKGFMNLNVSLSVIPPEKDLPEEKDLF
ncbi:MAG: trypsin-like peptidase domain-containing protein [Oligoflexales bacterium]